ncbi:hypothetical protein L227DRAFT_618174, partial [Lentinus tigrinus ALCF2SS1-6]
MYSPNIYSPDTSLPGTPATTVAIPSVAGSLLLSVEPPDDDKWRGHDSDFAPIQGTSTVFPVDLLPSIEAAAPTLRQLPDSRFDSRYTRRTEAPSTSRRRASNRLISGLQVNLKNDHDSCTISLYASVMERLNVVHKDSVSAFQETLRLARSNETHNVRDAKADDEIATRLAEIFDVLKAINNTMSRMYVLEGAKTNRFRMPQNFVGSTIGRVHMTEASHRQHMSTVGHFMSTAPDSVSDESGLVDFEPITLRLWQLLALIALGCAATLLDISWATSHPPLPPPKLSPPTPPSCK